MKSCERCERSYKASSRHRLCPKCRKAIYRNACPNCGNLKQKKSELCRSCFNKSKQYPSSSIKHRSKDGYIYVYFRNHPNADREGRIYEHRLIMEFKLGRYLLPTESVHHKNGRKDDNNIENLELWVKPQPTGARVEDVVKWAKEILRLYGDVSSVG